MSNTPIPLTNPSTIYPSAHISPLRTGPITATASSTLVQLQSQQTQLLRKNRGLKLMIEELEAKWKEIVLNQQLGIIGGVDGYNSDGYEHTDMREMAIERMLGKEVHSIRQKRQYHNPQILPKIYLQESANTLQTSIGCLKSLLFLQAQHYKQNKSLTDVLKEAVNSINSDHTNNSNSQLGGSKSVSSILSEYSAKQQQIIHSLKAVSKIQNNPATCMRKWSQLEASRKLMEKRIAQLAIQLERQKAEMEEVAMWNTDLNEQPASQLPTDRVNLAQHLSAPLINELARLRQLKASIEELNAKLSTKKKALEDQRVLLKRQTTQFEMYFTPVRLVGNLSLMRFHKPIQSPTHPTQHLSSQLRTRFLELKDYLFQLRLLPTLQPRSNLLAKSIEVDKAALQEIISKKIWLNRFRMGGYHTVVSSEEKSVFLSAKTQMEQWTHQLVDDKQKLIQAEEKKRDTLKAQLSHLQRQMSSNREQLNRIRDNIALYREETTFGSQL